MIAIRFDGGKMIPLIGGLVGYDVQSISAVTLAVRDMARSVAFYHDGAGISILYGGPEAGFTSLAIGRRVSEFDPG